ncbi:maltase A1 isoform X2 [Diachasma alloeum]|uniref:maltase A1 isoform X2 n=1 Tax=Diachasma alloeum TaxID=454923 RepID=UPI0007381AC6|nr:maltase A1 isoform X2 [Diachasma alloeum]
MATAGMGLAVLALFLVETGSAAGGGGEWWEDTLIYQIWPRAFQDSDGDGNGDLKGIVQRLDYLQDLGVETICLNPIYPSPMIASGYDVSNYTDIHPIFGDMGDFDVLVEEAHQRGLKVILDVVPNHSSNRHSWFNESINRIDPYTDYYVWADGRVDANGTRHPPNKWVNFMGYENGSAWTWNDVRGQWYYHKYLESQPDLNLRNGNVVEEILNIINFWLERGVDGFLISDVPYLFEDPVPTNESLSASPTGSFESPETSNLLYQIREYTNNWTDVNNSTGKLVMAEAWDSDENLISYYGSEERPGVVPLNFRLIAGVKEGVTAGDIKLLLEGWLKKLPDNWTTNWALSTDKHPRITSRVGDSKLPGYLTLSMLLPGQAYTYYGDEIGMTDSKAAWNDTEPPISPLLSPNSLAEYSGNAPRTPMQWNATTSAGFSTNDTTYLPVNDNYDYQNVERQFEKPESTLNTYKSLARLRKDPVFRDGDWEINTLNDDKILVLKRSLEGHPTYIILINTASERETANISSVYPDLQEHLIIVLSTGNSSNKSTTPGDRIKLLPDAAMVLKTSEDNETIGESPIEETMQSSVESDTINETTAAPTAGMRPLPRAPKVLKNPEDEETIVEPPVSKTIVQSSVESDMINETTAAPRAGMRPLPRAPKVLKNPEDEETIVESPVNKTMHSDDKHNRNNLMHELSEESADFSGGEMTDKSPTDNVHPGIDETSLVFNNFEEIQTKPRTNSKPIHYTPERVQTSTTQAPRSMNNAGEYVANSSACRNKMIKLVLGLVSTATLVLHYV